MICPSTSLTTVSSKGEKAPLLSCRPNSGADHRCTQLLLDPRFLPDAEKWGRRQQLVCTIAARRSDKRKSCIARQQRRCPGPKVAISGIPLLFRKESSYSSARKARA